MAVLVLVLCFLGGGSSREDAVSLLYLRPMIVLAIAAALLLPRIRDLARVRVPLLLLAAFAATMAIQLVPLPPSIWTNLPGHEPYAAIAGAAGIGQPWRPLSLTPDRTWNSLVALLPTLAILLCGAAMASRDRNRLIVILIAMIVASAALGVVQLSGAGYLYSPTNPGFPVGFFANRNHQAVFLALGFPLLRIWTLTPAPSGEVARLRVWTAIGTTLFLVPMILATGSRAGMAIGGVSLVFSALISPDPGPNVLGRVSNQRFVLWTVGVATIGIVLVAIWVGRAASIDRLIALSDDAGGLRGRYTPVVLRMTRDFLPFGTGYGAFDAVFRNYEPNATLAPRYFNRAHNDLLELVLVGGMPALLVLLAYLGWLGRRIVLLVGPYRTSQPIALFARLGAGLILFLFAASIVDYPLRTPLLSAVFAVATLWLCARPDEDPEPSRSADLALRRGEHDATGDSGV